MVVDIRTKSVEELLQEHIDHLVSLSALSATVARAASREETYKAALDCLERTLAPDRASVLLYDDDGIMRFKAWRGLSAEYRLATEGHSPWSRDTPDPTPVLVANVSEEPSLAELRGLIEGEGIRALGFFPLVARDRLLGKFMVYYDQPHVFVPTEVQLAQAIGAHIALEIGRASVEEELRSHSRRTERARSFAERHQRVTEALARSLTEDEIADTVVREGADALGAAAGWIAALSPDGSELRRLASAGYRTDLGDAYASLPMTLDNPTVDAVGENRSFWLESAEEVIAAYPALGDDYPATGFEAMAIVPLVLGERATGVIALNFREARSFDQDERALLSALAAQCAQAVERTRLYHEFEERANAASVLAHVGDGVFQLDSDDRIALWTRGAEVITGVSESEAVGRPVGKVLRGWDAIAPRIWVTDVPAAVGRREALRVEVRGREFWLAISGVASRDGTVYAFRDVTESEALEKTRRDLVSTVSHELRTPLAAVFGAAKTLRRRKLDDAQRDELLAVVDKETERLGRILEQLLLATQLDDRKVDVLNMSCELHALAAEVVTAERARLPAGISLIVEARGQVPRVECDREKVRQVLVNLIDNAIKYSPDGGRITVSLERLGHHVRMTVADKGLGIPHDELDKIFEKFYRLDPQLSRGVGGTGLGLYISRELIEQMHGRLLAESTPGVGSAFHIELPVAR